MPTILANERLTDSLLDSDNLKGFILAAASSAFIGSSFIIKKKGLKRAGVSGPRAGVGGYGYLLEPLWWIGMVTSKSLPLLKLFFYWRYILFSCFTSDLIAEKTEETKYYTFLSVFILFLFA